MSGASDDVISLFLNGLFDFLSDFWNGRFVHSRHRFSQNLDFQTTFATIKIHLIIFILPRAWKLISGASDDVIRLFLNGLFDFLAIFEMADLFIDNVKSLKSVIFKHRFQLFKSNFKNLFWHNCKIWYLENKIM